MSRRLFDALGELREPIGRAAHLLVGLDFDGTLSPIVARPELVALPAETRDALEAISARPDCTLAILSGRRLADVKDRVGIPGSIYAGNHGLEIETAAGRFIEPTAKASRPALATVAELVRAGLPRFPGARLEYKQLSLSVHFRQAAEDAEDGIRALVLRAVAAAPSALRLTE